MTSSRFAGGGSARGVAVRRRVCRERASRGFRSGFFSAFWAFSGCSAFSSVRAGRSPGLRRLRPPRLPRRRRRLRRSCWCVGGRVCGRCLYGVRLFSLLAGRLGRALSRLAPKPSQQVKTPSVMSRARRPAPETGRSARCEIDMGRISASKASSSAFPARKPAPSGCRRRPELRPPRPDRPEPLGQASPGPGLHLAVASRSLRPRRREVLEPGVGLLDQQQLERVRSCSCAEIVGPAPDGLAPARTAIAWRTRSPPDS